MAQRDLVGLRLENSELRAESDGFVVVGDLSQRIGAPVRKGEVLFRIAPLGQYRVVMKVNEHHIREVVKGLAGEVRLSGEAGIAWPITVTDIGSAEASDGVNWFRVEAQLQAGADVAALRPGMEGVAKLTLGSATLIDAWTRRSRQWLSLAWFKWTP